MSVYDNKDEIAAWEAALEEKNNSRLYKTRKNYRCPRGEKYTDYRRHHQTGHWHMHEDKAYRIMTNRHFRRRFKNYNAGECALIPVPHDYKTYGWLSW